MPWHNEGETFPATFSPLLLPCQKKPKNSVKQKKNSLLFLIAGALEKGGGLRNCESLARPNNSKIVLHVTPLLLLLV